MKTNQKRAKVAFSLHRLNGHDERKFNLLGELKLPRPFITFPFNHKPADINAFVMKLFEMAYLPYQHTWVKKKYLYPNEEAEYFHLEKLRLRREERVGTNNARARKYWIRPVGTDRRDECLKLSFALFWIDQTEFSNGFLCVLPVLELLISLSMNLITSLSLSLSLSFSTEESPWNNGLKCWTAASKYASSNASLVITFILGNVWRPLSSPQPWVK